MIDAYETTTSHIVLVKPDFYSAGPGHPTSYIQPWFTGRGVKNVTKVKKTNVCQRNKIRYIFLV